MEEPYIGIGAKPFNNWILVRATLGKVKSVLRTAGSLVWWKIYGTRGAEIFADSLREACSGNSPRVMWVSEHRVVTEGRCEEVRVIGIGHTADGRLVVARDASPEPILDLFHCRSVNAYVLLTRSETENIRKAIMSLLRAKPVAKSLYVTSLWVRPMCSPPEPFGRRRGVFRFLWRERGMGHWNAWRWAFDAVAKEMKRRGYVGFVDTGSHPPCMCLREKLGESLTGLQCLGFEFCVPARYRYKCPQCGGYKLFVRKPQGKVVCPYCEDGREMVEA